MGFELIEACELASGVEMLHAEIGEAGSVTLRHRMRAEILLANLQIACDVEGIIGRDADVALVTLEETARQMMLSVFSPERDEVAEIQGGLREVNERLQRLF